MGSARRHEDVRPRRVGEWNDPGFGAGESEPEYRRPDVPTYPLDKQPTPGSQHSTSETDSDWAPSLIELADPDRDPKTTGAKRSSAEKTRHSMAPTPFWCSLLTDDTTGWPTNAAPPTLEKAAHEHGRLLVNFQSNTATRSGYIGCKVDLTSQRGGTTRTTAPIAPDRHAAGLVLRDAGRYDLHHLLESEALRFG